MVAGDLLDDFFFNIIPLDIMNEINVIYMNFLEHYSCSKLKPKDFLEFQDKPLFRESFPRNISVNILLKIDTKGVSNLYMKLQPS